MIAALLALQAVTTPPDIEIGVRVEAREVTLDRRGSARLEVRAEPDGGSKVESNAPPARGRNKLRNVDLTVSGEARIRAPETPLPDPR